MDPGLRRDLGLAYGKDRSLRQDLSFVRDGRPSHDADVFELPGIVAVEILGKEPPAILQRRPVAPYADDIAEIGPANFEHALEIQFLRLDNTALRVLDRPDDSGENRRGDLQRGRIVVRRDAARLGERQPRAIPIDALLRPEQQDA